MRRFGLFVALAVCACRENAAQTVSPAPSGTGGSGGVIGAAGPGGGGRGSAGSAGAGGAGAEAAWDIDPSDQSNEDATVDDNLASTIDGPTQLVTDDGALIGITADDRIAYSTQNGLWTIKAAEGAPARKAANTAGTAIAMGRTVANFANIDWQHGTGMLTIWTPKVGRRSLGTALADAQHLAVRNDDAWVLLARNVTPQNLDIAIASADGKNHVTLTAGVPRGDNTTCGPSFGFAGPAVILAWCARGSFSATLARFDLGAQGWQSTIVSDAASGAWASDATGQRLFYVDQKGAGHVLAPDGDHVVGQGVGWGMLSPDGKNAFFTVGDQLRKSDLKGDAVPIVVDGFQRATAWKPDLSLVVYASQVVYTNNAERQDLRATPTAWFNPSPTVLVAQPIATLARSVLTTSGGHVLYFTGDGAQQTLKVQPIDGRQPVSLTGIDSALAASADLVLITDNRKDGYPTLADLELYDASGAMPRHLLQGGIVDGRDVQVTADKLKVAYHLPATENGGGIWLQPIQ